MGPIQAVDFAFGDFVLWVLYVVALVLLFPMLGILVYLITQGDGMAHRVQSARHRALVAAGFSLADELEKTEKLHKAGKLSDEEYQRLRARLIG